jgi:hypothetical protein
VSHLHDPWFSQSGGLAMVRWPQLSYDADRSCFGSAEDRNRNAEHAVKGEIIMAKGKGAQKKEVKKPKKDKSSTSAKDGKKK